MQDNLPNPQVQSGAVDPTATPAVPVPVESVAPATPSTPSPDAEAQKLLLLEQKVNKYESDIRALKSTSDKRYSDAERQWKQQTQTLQEELRSLRIAGMDDEQRKVYESSLAVEKQNQIMQELEQTRQASQETQTTLQAYTYFLQNGVPADKMVLDQGYDALFNSGMSWLTEAVKTARQSAQPSSGQSQSNLPNPPVVATAGHGVPVVKPTWDDLHKKYGDDEQIYRLVESGLLPSDIIPT